LITLFLLALILRLGYVLLFPWDIAGRRFDPQKIYQDERRYDSVATHLLDGEGFVNASDTITVVPPVYPLFLAALYGMFGHAFTAVRLFQTLISALTCVLIYYLGKETFNSKVGRLAALLAVIYPFFFVWCRVLVTETLTAFLVSLGVLWLLKTAADPSPRNRIVSGSIWGTVALVRANMLVFLPLIILWAFLEFGLHRKALYVAGTIIGVAGLILMPWTVRNVIKYRKPVLVASYGGSILYAANNPYSLPYEPYDTQKQNPEPEIVEWLEERPRVETDDLLLRRGLRYIIERPRTFFWSAYGRLTVFWRPVTLDTVRERLSMQAGFMAGGGLMPSALRLGLPFLIVADGFFLGLACVGLFLAVHKRRARVFYVSVLAFVLMHLAAVVVGNGRFRLPLMPVLIAFAGYAIYAVITGPDHLIAEQRPGLPKSWIVLLLLGALSITVGRALGLGNELRPVEGPPYEVESFAGVTPPSDGDYAQVADEGWTYFSAPSYSGGHAALTGSVESSVRQQTDELGPGDYKLSVIVGRPPVETGEGVHTNRLQISLNGVSRILEWSNDGQDWQRVELVLPEVPRGDSLLLRPLAIGGRYLIVDKVELARQ
jgi:4-amino-4-deoxy-L-arabinose transferase-like glycosyltransferase